MDWLGLGIDEHFAKIIIELIRTDRPMPRDFV